MTTPDLVVCENLDTLAARAAGTIARAAQEAVRRRRQFTWALAGGSTPQATYRLLAQPEPAAVPWSDTYLFFSDERFVPPDDPRSNYAMARQTLLAEVPLPAGHVFAIPTASGSPAEGAAAYAEQLRSFFSLPDRRTPPRFDLILLGMGDDGHVASLFPGAAALTAADTVTWSPPGILPPAVDRITFTYQVLNAARQVLFLVAGEKKGAALRDVLRGGAFYDVRPAAGVQPADGTVTWLVDRSAAQLLGG